MELGALICTPRQPKCAMCPLRAECVAFRTGRVEQIPNLAARATATARYVSAFVAEHHGKFLVRQRPAGQVNAHLWEFPNGETPSEDFDPVKLAREILGFKPTGVTELCVIKHTITRYRITLRVFRADPSASHKLNPKSVWLSHDELNQLAFTSAHRRILQIIQKTGKTADEA